MNFKFKAGKYKNKNFIYVRNKNPWYIRDIREEDPKAYNTLTKTQKKVIDNSLTSFNKEDDVYVDTILQHIEDGYEKREIYDMFIKDNQFSHLGEKIFFSYYHLAIKKFKSRLEEKQRETLSVHLERYENSYLEEMEKSENPVGKTKEQKFHYKIDKLVTSLEILMAKEKLMGIHTKKAPTLIWKRELDDNHYNQGNTSRMHDFSEVKLDALIKARDLVSESLEEQNRDETEITVKTNTPFARLFGMSDEDFEVPEDANTEDISYEEVNESPDIKQIEHKSKKKKDIERGKGLNELQNNLVKKDAENLNDSLNKKKDKKKLIEVLKRKK